MQTIPYMYLSLAHDGLDCAPAALPSSPILFRLNRRSATVGMRYATTSRRLSLRLDGPAAGAVHNCLLGRPDIGGRHLP